MRMIGHVQGHTIVHVQGHTGASQTSAKEAVANDSKAFVSVFAGLSHSHLLLLLSVGLWQHPLG